MVHKAPFLRSALVAVALVATGSAQAQGNNQAPPAQTPPAPGAGNRGGWAKAHILGYLDVALSQNPLSAGQRQTVAGDVDQLVSQAQSQQAQRKAATDRDLQLFTADNLDQNALQQSEQQQANQAISRWVAFTAQVHDALTPAQRQELATYLRQHPFEHGGMGGGF